MKKKRIKSDLIMSLLWTLLFGLLTSMLFYQTRNKTIRNVLARTRGWCTLPWAWWCHLACKARNTPAPSCRCGRLCRSFWCRRLSGTSQSGWTSFGCLYIYNYIYIYIYKTKFSLKMIRIKYSWTSVATLVWWEKLI